MRVRRRTPVICCGLAIGWIGLGAAPTGIAAQVTCGWCWSFVDDFSQAWHGFAVEGGDECGDPAPEYEGLDVGRSRCGGTSHCHSYSDSGFCHIECGPGGGNGNGAGNGNGNFNGNGDQGPSLAGAIKELDRALGGGDVAAVAAVLADRTPAYTAEFTERAGRIVIMQACDPVRPVAAFVVPVAIRPALARLLAAEN